MLPEGTMAYPCWHLRAPPQPLPCIPMALSFWIRTPTRVLTTLLSAPLLALAGPQMGEPLPELELKDQFEQPWRIPPDTRLVLFSAGRKASDLVQSVLGEQAKGFLPARQTVYLADMSRMPGFVTRTFALPVLRAMPFSVGVVLDEQLLANWPRQDGAVTLIGLQDGRVQSVGYASTEADLRGALGLAP